METARTSLHISRHSQRVLHYIVELSRVCLMSRWKWVQRMVQQTITGLLRFHHPCRPRLVHCRHAKRKRRLREAPLDKASDID
jgi:hypothetical protein